MAFDDTLIRTGKNRLRTKQTQRRKKSERTPADRLPSDQPNIIQLFRSDQELVFQFNMAGVDVYW